DLRRPGAVLQGLGADARALGEVLVRPHVDDLVERADLGVPEGRERRVLLAVLVRLAEPLLHFAEAAGGDAIRPNLVDHGRLLSRGSRSRGRGTRASRRVTGG